jgi:hypothetical protein
MNVSFPLAVAMLMLVATPVLAAQVDFEQQVGQFVIRVDGRAIATYVYQDDDIPRPYFAHVKAPSGQQVTRNLPPVEGIDATDHDTIHPGIWLAFGDLDGSDFWRNKARVVHQRFVVPPVGGSDRGCFVEDKNYFRKDGSVVCRERFECAIVVRDGGYLLIWNSTFDADQSFFFGDQEEMGIGFRVTTPLTEQNGGQLTDSAGRVGAEAIWSQAAKWCDYSGSIDNTHLGMTLLCHADNFGPSWMHARDYGFCAANPFGRQAMNKGEHSRIDVSPGEKLRLRYGIWIHSSPAKDQPLSEILTELNAVYDDYLQIADQSGCSE